MTIGLAMNSVYYYKKEKDGPTFNSYDSEVKKQGKQMASEILSRLRENDDLNTYQFILQFISNQVKIQSHQVNLSLKRLQKRVKQSLINYILMKNQLYYLLHSRL